MEHEPPTFIVTSVEHVSQEQRPRTGLSARVAVRLVVLALFGRVSVTGDCRDWSEICSVTHRKGLLALLSPFICDW
jgi:hypothetical protein